MIHGMRWVGLGAARVAALVVLGPAGWQVRGWAMSIVMGLDQHRAQITAEWIDTATGEVSRARVAPADRAGVRRFCERFGGEELEVALEATTGWRFVVEELAPGRRRGASGRAGGDQRAARATRSARRPTGRTPGICASC